MSNSEAPREEQQICIGCGLCCDGTLFIHAVLNPGEKGNLPEKIEESSFTEGDKEYFRLPCGYFCEKCTIYDKKRADVCGSYRCQLLRDFANHKISLEEALTMVKEARSMRSDLMEQYMQVSCNKDKIHFMKALSQLAKALKSVTGNELITRDYELLQVRCNIFEALLIRHFRSAEDFNKMIMR